MAIMGQQSHAWVCINFVGMRRNVYASNAMSLMMCRNGDVLANRYTCIVVYRRHKVQSTQWNSMHKQQKVSTQQRCFQLQHQLVSKCAGIVQYMLRCDHGMW